MTRTVTGPGTKRQKGEASDAQDEWYPPRWDVNTRNRAMHGNGTREDRWGRPLTPPDWDDEDGHESRRKQKRRWVKHEPEDEQEWKGWESRRPKWDDGKRRARSESPIARKEG